MARKAPNGDGGAGTSKAAPTAKKKRAPRKSQKTTPRRIHSLELAREALEYRKAGFSYVQIGEAISRSPAEAHRLVMAAIAEITREPAEEVLSLELQRLDALLVPQMEKAGKGDIDAMNGCLAIMARRAKLLGLDLPTKIAATTPDGKEAAPMTGVLAVPVAIDPEAWAQGAADYQAKIKAMTATPSNGDDSAG